jgi:hypothetical protein
MEMLANRGGPIDRFGASVSGVSLGLLHGTGVHHPALRPSVFRFGVASDEFLVQRRPQLPRAAGALRLRLPIAA